MGHTVLSVSLLQHTSFRDIFFWIDQARASGAPPDRPYPDQPPYLDHQPPHPGRQPQDQVHLKQES